MPSSRRSTRSKRCPRCMVHQLNCFCEKISTVPTKTKLSLIIFKKEIFLPSNTAHLSLKSLSNSQAFERGHRDKSLGPNFIDSDNYHPLFLYPDESAIELDSNFIAQLKKPVNLIVPDGTWRQAKKIKRREPLLENVQSVKITPSQKSIYPLRRQKFEYGLCTHEAISYAFEILESQGISQMLLHNLEIFIEAHLKHRVIY
ncbi:MAG: tRNA-uridine aminocarboxypropyltransferase [Bacteriovoracaceae bacterium]|nr:tRNA-uridine aminocarboxypropyltransferase [Bacteriovoracaceae bacterium]